MVRETRKKLLLKSARYMPVIALIVAMILAMIKSTTVFADEGTINPYEASPA